MKKNASVNFVFLAASCPQCNENASCFNSTHCVCKEGFWTGSENRRIIEPHEKCQGKIVYFHMFSIVMINTMSNLGRKWSLSSYTSR
jgi:hypothetical protein